MNYKFSVNDVIVDRLGDSGIIVSIFRDYYHIKSLKTGYIQERPIYVIDEHFKIDTKYLINKQFNNDLKELINGNE